MTLAKNGDLYIPSADTMVIIDKYGIVKEKRTIEGLKGRGFMFSTGGDTVFYFTGGGGLFDAGAINAANLNGDLLWSYEFATHNLGTPLIDNQNKIYVFGKDLVPPNYYYLYCIKRDGILDWRYRIDRYEDYSAPTIDKNGNIIFHVISDVNPNGENIIVSLDYYGKENWMTSLPGDFESSIIDHGLVCDAEGKIYCGSTFGGYIYCLSSDGVVLWTLDLGEYEYDSSPAIGSDGTLYVGTHLGSLFQNHEQNLIAIRDTVTSVQNNDEEILSYQLRQNYPNPFNSLTHIRYKIPKSGVVLLKVYDILGNEVSTLLDRFQDSGEYDVIYQADNLSSGIYFYTLSSGYFRDTKKLILLK
jgi:outer membrane protein assembly factor BamB